MDTLRYYSFLRGDDYQYSFDGRPIKLEIQEIKEWELWVVFNTPYISDFTRERLQTFLSFPPRFYDIQPEEGSDPMEWDNSSEVYIRLDPNDLNNSALLTAIKNGIANIVLEGEEDFDSLKEVESPDEFQE